MNLISDSESSDSDIDKQKMIEDSLFGFSIQPPIHFTDDRKAVLPRASTCFSAVYISLHHTDALLLTLPLYQHMVLEQLKSS